MALLHRSKPMVCFLLLLLLTLILVIPAVKAWDQGDFEIFDLVDELEKSEGAKTDFYTYLGISSSTPLSELNRAYRRKSLAMHPDKNKDDPKAKERFARLGKIIALLRDPERRERYNFFYKNGVPSWRGTGYLYRRYRPGFGTAVVIIVGFSAVLHYLAARISYARQGKKIRLWVQDAREVMAKYAPKSQGPPKFGKTYIELGRGGDSSKAMRCEVVGDAHIRFFPENGEVIDMNEEWLPKPTVWDVFLFAIPVAILGRLRTRKAGGQAVAGGEKEEDDDEDEEEEKKEDDKGEDKQEKGKEKRAKHSPRPTMVAGGRRKNARR